MTNPGMNYIPGGVIRWEDDAAPAFSVYEQLRLRPGVWATLGQNITHGALGISGTPWAPLRGHEDIEIDYQPVDDGEYGVLYDVQARFIDDEEQDQPHAR